ncbi:MAG: hypothetical protein A3A90_00815 [Candidatus Zambryskibacteria bacterium RIFCSPLOWO2_01_FULL_35_19]|uniref:Uncharacterized protein n=1 Tax=Candidatus Zambryskibacteria bacterium RIFCSPLOWO2_01_FULL_35_19 TaxID=1802757 RepID=A0A1G2U0G9_9BACT|nr:MAG: hypothetical protein A2726_00150 [Candidatus Zambryskibacteria bacterium RIFCSPHIGHO2_01_FULL_35_32]OHB02322.1 MAG: hypothetical protein A3A90_00815 [Candidatus Zambryskibacteria bacterium RIFCSPLOWO2_01_FULL_35_19]
MGGAFYHPQQYTVGPMFLFHLKSPSNSSLGTCRRIGLRDPVRAVRSLARPFASPAGTLQKPKPSVFSKFFQNRRSSKHTTVSRFNLDTLIRELGK